MDRILRVGKRYDDKAVFGNKADKQKRWGKISNKMEESTKDLSGI